MAISLGNRAKMSTSTTGTGTITLGSAEAGYQTFDAAGITNGQTVRYVVEDGSNFEIGSGTYTTSGTTLTRTVTESNNSDNAITLSGAAKVFLAATVADLYINDGANSLTTTGTITAVLKAGGNFDTNSHNILIDDAHFIADESGNEQIIFQTTGSAVNQFDVTNAASGNGPKLSATGGDTNIDLDLLAKGSGIVKVISPGGSGNSGAIQLNCEANSHGQILKSQPHSASATNTMLLPEGANSTLVSLVSSDTLTNKTLTAPKIADGGFIADANGNQLIVFQTTGSAVNELEITNNASGSNPIIAATGGDTNIGIALTPKGTGEIVIAAGNLNYGGTAVTSTGAELNLLDGITAGTISASLAVIADGAKDLTGGRNLTISGELDAATGDFSGAVDIAGDLTLSAGADGALNFSAASSVKILDNNAASLVFEEANNAYMTFVTTNSSEAVKFDKALDINGAVQLDATLTVGVDDTGYDVKFFGDTASAFMQWDASADDLILGGAAGLVVPDGKLTLASTAVTSTAAELNQLDGKVAKTAGLETIWVPATAMYPATTNGSSALTQVETTALRPDLMVLDFAAAADDFAQFSIGFPKSWNEGTVKFQVFWTPSNTNTDDCIWGLQGVSVADGATIDVVYGTAITVTDAGIGTVEDQQVSPVSGAVTITNAAVDTQTYFQIFRDGNAGGDTFSGVSRLLGIKLFFTTDAANDA